MTFKLITIYLMSVLYISSGVQHFANTGWFMKIMPPYLPYHKELIYLSGVFEIILGSMLLFEKTRFLAGWGLILLLLLYFLQIYMLHKPMGLPWVLLLQLHG